MLSPRIQFFLIVSTLFPAIRQHRLLGRRCGWDFLISNLNPLISAVWRISRPLCWSIYRLQRLGLWLNRVITKPKISQRLFAREKWNFFSEVRASLLKCALMAYEISERLYRRVSPILISVLLVWSSWGIHVRICRRLQTSSTERLRPRILEISWHIRLAWVRLPKLDTIRIVFSVEQSSPTVSRRK